MLVFLHQIWYYRYIETVTISKAEYEEFQSINEQFRALKLQNVDLQQRIDFLMAQSKEKLPDDIPVEVVEHTLPADEQVCPECGNQLHVIGKNVRETLKLIPAKAVIERHIQYVYGCRNCEKNACCVPVIKAKEDTPLIKGSIATAEAVAQIMTQKFVMAVPLYRQEQEWSRNGIPLSRQTMSNWLIKCTEDYLIPIYDNLHEQLLKQEVLHADELCETSHNSSYVESYVM